MDGTLNLTDLPKGNYRLIEQEAPSGYLLNSEPIEFTLDSRTGTKALELDVPNYKEAGEFTGKIEISKKDEIGTVLSGAVFEIRDMDGNVVETITSGNDGKAISGNLVAGEYTVVETTAPIGYILDKTEHKVTIEGLENEVIYLNIVNKKDIEITDKSEENTGVLPETGDSDFLLLGIGTIILLGGVLLINKQLR